MSVGLGIPLYMPLIDKSIPRSSVGLDSLLMTPTLFISGILGIIMLAPEIYRFGGANAQFAAGTEFLLTRAINRNILFRSRAALFFMVVLALPLVIFILSIREPNVQVMGYSTALREQVRRDLPQSIIIPDKKHPKVKEFDQILIPDGRVWAAAWCIWKFFVTAIGVEILILLVYPLKYRRAILATIFIAAILLPFGLIFLDLRKNASDTHAPDTLSFNETTFFSYVAHLPAMWLLTVAALILAQLWCERRFARFEQ